MSATERGCKLHRLAETFVNFVEPRRFVMSIWMVETAQPAHKVTFTKKEIRESPSLGRVLKVMPCALLRHPWLRRGYVIRVCLAKPTEAREILFICHTNMPTFWIHSPGATPEP